MKPKRINFKFHASISQLILLIAVYFLLSPLIIQINANPGIYRTINFQGKIVNKIGGTNIQDNSYSFTFKFYDAPSNGNQLPTGSPWSETQSITVTNGIFRATLGSSTPIPSTLNFNDDSIYLDITFNGETFGTRVRMTAVPYALNAEKVGGLTVTNTTGTLTIPNGKTIQFADAFTTSGAYPLTLTVSNTTNATLPTGTITLADLTTSQILTSKTIGSTGLIFSSAATDISTVSNEDLAIVPNGTGKVGIGTTSPGKMLDVFGSATVSGDITMGGQLQVGRFNADPVQVGIGSIYYNTVSNKFRCYISNAWADCDTTGGGPGGGENYWSLSSVNGTISPMNTTLDFLLGSTSTSSAKIALTNIFSGNPTASLAGNLALTSPTGVNPATTYNIFNGGSFNLQTSVGGNAGLTSRLFINNSGNIGIGTTTPGALLQLSSSQVGSTLLDVVFNGSSAFTVSDTGIINNLPASFNAPGDVSIAYDINFTNPTASYIKSAAPLYIQAGETFNSSDLNLITYNKGNVIVTSEAFSVVGSATVSAVLNVGTNATVAGTFALAPQVQQYAGVCNATNAGKMYYDASQNSYYFCNASTWTQVGSGSPGGSGTNYWSLSSNGTLSPMNTTVDLLLGETATSSAKIGLINIFSGLPSATFSGNLAIKVPTDANAATVYDVYNGASINFRTSVGGEAGATSRLFIANNGNIGLGDSNPVDKLDVNGNATIAGDLTLDSGARTIAARAYNPLTIGDSQTGDLLLSPKGSLSGVVQIGTGGAGTNTPDLLALDVKSDGADPVGFEGAIYYNTNTNKFRCFEGSAWANCIAGSITDTDKITFIPWSACSPTGVTNCTVSGIGCVATTNMTALGQKGATFAVDMDVYNNVILRYSGALAGSQTGTVTVNLRNYTAGNNTVTTSFNSGTTCTDRSSALTDVSALTGVVRFGLQIGDATTTDDPLLSGVVVEFSK